MWLLSSSCKSRGRDDEDSDTEALSPLWHRSSYVDNAKRRRRAKFEDNLETPSQYSFVYLHGRCMSGFSRQPLGAQWVYQRFVNRAAQLFTKAQWYEVTLDSDEIEQSTASVFVFLLSLVTAPLVFPIIYFFAAFGLLALTPYIRSIKKSDAKPLARFDEKFSGVPQDKPRYTYSEIAWAAFESLWLCWMSLCPWIYLVQGRFLCDTMPNFEDDFSCAQQVYTFSPLLVFTPWMCCMVAAWRNVHGVLASSYSCAVLKQQLHTHRDPIYGETLREVVKVLGNPKNPKSFYPIFMDREEDQPDKLPGRAARHVFRLVALLHSILPLFWYMFRYKVAFLPSVQGNLWPEVVVITGVIAPNIELFGFIHDFYTAGVEFQHVVDELVLMIYLGSSCKSKKRPTLKRHVHQIWMANDMFRKNHRDQFTKGDSMIDISFMEDWKEREFCLQTQDGATLQRRDTLGDLADAGEAEPSMEGATAVDPSDHSTRRRYDELQDLHVHQVAFNFFKKEGVLLFRRFRRFVRMDIFNERKEVEQYINCSLFVMACMGVILFATRWYYNHVTVICLVFPFDISVLAILILSSVNKCVAANECLFGSYERVLLSWKEQTLDPDSFFSHEEADSAVAFVWDLSSGKAKPLKLEIEAPRIENETEGARRAELRETLDIAATMETVLEDKQRILGFEVTKELRNRLVASLLSVLVAVISKNIMVVVTVLQTTYDSFGERMRPVLWELVMDRGGAPVWAPTPNLTIWA